MSEYQKVEKWTERWLPKIKGEVILLIFSKNIYSEIREIVTNNEVINQDNPFYNWTTRNYLHTVLLGIRRQLDNHKDVISLIKLVTEMKDNNHCISKERFIDNCFDPDDPISRDLASEKFDNLSGCISDVYPRDKLDKDLEKLNEIDSIYRIYIDKRIAHFDKVEIPSQVLELQDLNDSITSFEEMVKRYYELLTPNGVSLQPKIITGDWKHIFRYPWLSEGS